jgi:tripartite-type tricarboxylate transporter receptor subunit TctC
VRIVIAFPPGGIVDFAIRAIAPGLSDVLRQPMVLENRGGASGMIASELVAKAPPDGYTFLAHSNASSSAPHTQQAAPAIDMQRDLLPVTQFIDSPNILVVIPSLPVKSVKELVSLATRRKGEITVASAGVGSGTHLSAELFKSLAHVDLIHIAYKGGGPAVSDLLGGHVAMMFSTMPSVMQQIRAGRLRALAVTSAKRFSGTPEYPTMIEAGVPGFEFSGWSGMFAPTGTPREIVNRMSDEASKLLRSPGIREKLLPQGAEPVGSTPEEFAAFYKSEYSRWGKLVRQNGIKGE